MLEKLDSGLTGTLNGALEDFNSYTRDPHHDSHYRGDRHGASDRHNGGADHEDRYRPDDGHARGDSRQKSKPKK